MAKHSAVEFFKKKSDENNEVYQKDMGKILEQYDEFRKNYFLSEKKVDKLVKVVCRQERIGSEIKTFLTESLNQIFYTVRRKQPEIYEQILLHLPTD